MRETLEIDDLMARAPVIPVLVLERADDAAPMATALVRGGLPVLEVTLRTDAGLDAIGAMSHVEGGLVGAGTVVNGRQVKAAVEAGARFIVSPGLTAEVADAARALNVPLLAGVATASDIMRGLDLGLTRFKFFPAETSGGALAIRAFGGPFGQVKFCPTGGVTLANASSYLALDNVLCVGGSWITPSEAVLSHDWPRVETLARGAAALKS